MSAFSSCWTSPPWLTPSPTAGPTILRLEYYIELLQTSWQLTNGTGSAFTLLMFHGVSDLRTLSPADVQAQLLKVTFQDGPINLQPAGFNLSSARTDSTELRSEIEAKILRLSFSMVCNALFLELCPGYSSQPHAAIDHISQIHVDYNGNQVASTVQAYFQQLMGAAVLSQANGIFQLACALNSRWPQPPPLNRLLAVLPCA